jgi:tryptophan synthase alpha subunit
MGQGGMAVVPDLSGSDSEEWKKAFSAISIHPFWFFAVKTTTDQWREQIVR